VLCAHNQLFGQWVGPDHNQAQLHVMEKSKLYYVVNPNPPYTNNTSLQLMMLSSKLETEDWEEHFRQSPLANKWLQRNATMKFHRIKISSFTSNLVVQDYFARFKPQPINVFGLADINPLDFYMVFPKVIISW